jgi:hypothetical protein
MLNDVMLFDAYDFIILISTCKIKTFSKIILCFVRNANFGTYFIFQIILPYNMFHI